MGGWWRRRRVGGGDDGGKGRGRCGGGTTRRGNGDDLQQLDDLRLALIRVGYQDNDHVIYLLVTACMQ